MNIFHTFSQKRDNQNDEEHARNMWSGCSSPNPDKIHFQTNWAQKILIALCLLIPTAFSFHTFDQFAIPKQMIFNMGCGLLLLLVLFNFKKLYALPKYLRYAIIFFFVTQVYQTVRLTDPANGLFGAYGQSESFLVQCGFLILFFSGYLFIKKESAFSRINLALIITIYLTGIFGIYQYYLNDPISHTSITRVKSLLGDPNSFGVFLILAMVLVFNEIEATKKPWRRLLAAGSIYIGITVLVLTFSRASWLGFLISFTIYFLGMLIHYRNSQKPLTDFKALFISLVLIIVIGIISAEVLTLFQPKSHADYEIKARITSMVNGNDSGRGLLWSTALNIFKNSPFLGFGINSFQDNFHHFKSKKAVLFWGPDRDLLQTHNESLHYLATQGLLGLGAYLGLLLAIFMAVKPLKLLKSQSSSTVIALCSAIGGYLVFIQFAYPLIHYSFLFWICLGALVGLQSPVPETTLKSHGIQNISDAKTSDSTLPQLNTINSRLISHVPSLNNWAKYAVIFLLISGWGLIQYNSYIADVYYRQAFYQARYHHYPVSLANYQKVISLTPWIDYYKYRYAVTLFRAAKRELTNASLNIADAYFAEAKKILDDLMKKSPGHYQFIYLLGQIAETKHQFEVAEKYYQTAHTLYPKNFKLIFRLAKMELLLGNTKKASLLFNSGLDLNAAYMKETALKEAVF